MISAAVRIATVLAVATAAAAVADPVDKAHLRTSPKSSQASPGVYFDPASGQFRQKPPSAASIARYSERSARRGGEESGEGGGPLSSSEETHLSAVLPLVRFTRKKEGRSEEEAGGGESEGGTRGGSGDILKVKRKKKLKSSVAQETIRSRPSSRVKLKRKGGNGKVVGKKKIRVRPRENDFEDDEDGGADGDAFFGDYGSESRASLRNAPGRQFGAASNR